MAQQRCALGSVVILFSVLGSWLCIHYGWTGLSRPWGFLLGFACGVSLGIGTALALKGIVAMRASRE
jgi:hypothetical protein